MPYGYEIESSKWGFSVVDDRGAELNLFETIEEAKNYIEFLETNNGYTDWYGKFKGGK